MSTLDDFIEPLNANPTDHLLKLVYADALDEHGLSSQAEAYRILAYLRRAPKKCRGGRWYYHVTSGRNFFEYFTTHRRKEWHSGTWAERDRGGMYIKHSHILPVEWVDALTAQMKEDMLPVVMGHRMFSPVDIDIGLAISYCKLDAQLQLRLNQLAGRMRDVEDVPCIS